MFWYKVPFGKKNFGDILGPYIVKKLSGKEVAYIPLLHQWFSKDSLIAYPKALYTRKLNFTDVLDNIKFLIKGGNVLITAGSIIGWYSSPKCDIWGAGIILKEDKVNNANFYAVRGKFTQQRLSELGYNVPVTIGDPALLMPLLYKPKETGKKYKIGIVPHHFHFNEVLNKVKSSEIKVISLLDEIEKVIDEINSCEVLISSSLHGIIISHAYKKPCLWCNLSERTIGGDNIKFDDYFSSIEMSNYNIINLESKYFDNEAIKELLELFNNKKKESYVSDYKIIEKIQSNLIKSAPFEVLDTYKI